MKYTDSNIVAKYRAQFENVALTFGSQTCLSMLPWNTYIHYLHEPTSRYIQRMKKKVLFELQAIDSYFASEHFTM